MCARFPFIKLSLTPSFENPRRCSGALVYIRGGFLANISSRILLLDFSELLNRGKLHYILEDCICLIVNSLCVALYVQYILYINYIRIVRTQYIKYYVFLQSYCLYFMLQLLKNEFFYSQFEILIQ